jgi:hypothetical protein
LDILGRGYIVHKAKGDHVRLSAATYDWNISFLANAILSVYDGGAVQHCISVYLARAPRYGPPPASSPREFRYSDHSMHVPADFSLSTATSTSSKKHRVRVHEHICSWAGLNIYGVGADVTFIVGARHEMMLFCHHLLVT